MADYINFYHRQAGEPPEGVWADKVRFSKQKGVVRGIYFTKALFFRNFNVLYAVELKTICHEKSGS